MIWIAAELCVAEIVEDIPAAVRHVSVADLVANDGSWNWNLINWLPANLLNLLAAIPPPRDANGKDISFWANDNHGQFTVSSAYELIMDYDPCADENVWKTIWKLQVPERVRCFIWLLKHGRILTNYRKNKMKLGTPFCSFCGDIVETELHVLRDCPKCLNVWINVVEDNDRSLFFNTDFHQWITLNINGGIRGTNMDNWPSYWATSCHAIWGWRNREQHDDNFFRPSDTRLHLQKRVHDYSIAMKANNVMNSSSRTTRQVGWFPPCVGWVAVNTDGAKSMSHSSGCGGLVHGSMGEWLGGFAKGLGECSIEMAELWGAWEGLKLAWELGFKHVELRLDALHVVKMLTKEKPATTFGWNICNRIWATLERDWEVRICHTYREGNSCADSLAHIGCSLGTNVIFYESCPTQIRNLVSNDARGTTVPRTIIV
jgi:ribonuclease HI